MPVGLQCLGFEQRDAEAFAIARSLAARLDGGLE
jgi:hypothetical protein